MINATLKTVTAIAVLLLLAGCVKAVTTTAGIAAGAAGAAAKSTVKATGAAIDMATPEKHEEEHHGHHDGDDPRPFDETSDAMMDVNAALAAAGVSGKRVLLVMGGNWCHDSRGLAAKFEEPELAAVIADSYELVWVDVGYRDRNLHVAERFGVYELLGTPTVLILSPAGELLNADSVHDWRTADSKPYDETLEYFITYAGETP